MTRNGVLGLLGAMLLGGGAQAAMPLPAASVLTAGVGEWAEQVRDRGRGQRCFYETRRVRFIDRFGRPQLRVVQRRVCRW